MSPLLQSKYVFPIFPSTLNKRLPIGCVYRRTLRVGIEYSCELVNPCQVGVGRSFLVLRLVIPVQVAGVCSVQLAQVVLGTMLATIVSRVMGRASRLMIRTR